MIVADSWGGDDSLVLRGWSDISLREYAMCSRFLSTGGAEGGNDGIRYSGTSRETFNSSSLDPRTYIDRHLPSMQACGLMRRRFFPPLFLTLAILLHDRGARRQRLSPLRRATSFGSTSRT